MACIFCQSENRSVFIRTMSFNCPLVYYRCQRCGLVYQLPEESEAADPAFYAATYRQLYQDSPEPTRKDLWVQSKRADHLLEMLAMPGFPMPTRVLDIGASAGLLLKAFHDAFDAAVVGVEPGDAYRTYAAKQGISMYASLDDLIASAQQHFDLISLIHVLEHLVDPVQTLNTIRKKLLSPTGRLILEVPNFYAHDSYELAHLACYTPHTLREVIRQAGYRLLKTRSHGVPRSKRLNLYLTVIAEPLPEGHVPDEIQPEKFVALKRRVGMLRRRVIQKIFPHQAWLPLPRSEEA